MIAENGIVIAILKGDLSLGTAAAAAADATAPAAIACAQDERKGGYRRGRTEYELPSHACSLQGGEWVDLELGGSSSGWI
ncbi:MAG: hypothetical protein ABI382_10530 [Nakamurella sp.]